MKYCLSFKVEINFVLTDEEFQAVDEAIRTCNETKRYAEVGGFWYGNVGTRTFLKEEKPEEECFLSATYSDMDRVIIKALEQRAMFHNPNYETNGTHLTLYRKFMSMLKDANEMGSCLNIHSAVIEV